MNVREHPLRKALPLFLLAGFCLSSLDTTAKVLVQTHALFLVVWARYVGQMVVVTPFVWHHAGRGFWRTRNLRLQMARSLFLLIATGCFFGGLRYLPLAEGSAITFLAPIFVVVLSQPVLGERPTRARWIASITGLVGILVLLRPGSAILHPAVLLLLAAALSNALYQLLTRKLHGDGVHTALFYSALAGAVGLTLVLPWVVGHEAISMRDAGLFILLGILAGLGHWCMISAYQRVPAASLTPYTYVQMIWATAFGYWVFGQFPDFWSMLGMLIILASGVLLALQERRAARAALRIP
jgi:drug/metabolite transporter (DMT)-like permease